MTEATTERLAADRDPVHLRAAEWLVRLQDADISLDEVMAWQSWVNADPKHATAFERMQEMTLQLRSLPEPRRGRRLSFLFDGYDASVPLSQWQPQRRRVLAAAAVLLAAVGIAWYATTNRPAEPDVLATALAENRMVTLADGSTVTLGGKTRLAVAFDGHQRKIELTEGEAFFRVAKDAQRPFKVQAGDTTVVAVGTQFNVRHGHERVVVSVLEGQVRLEPTPGLLPAVVLERLKPNLAPVRLAAGQQAIATDNDLGSAEPLVDPSAAIAWQAGRLAFRRQPLRFVLEDVNRYAAKPIVVSDAAIGELRVTGTVDASNLSGWLASLESVFELQAVEATHRIVLRRASPPGSAATLTDR